MHLIKPLVALSSSIAALALTVGLQELRLQCVGVPNLTDSEVKAFLLQLFEEFNFDKKNIKAAVDKITPDVGNIHICEEAWHRQLADHMTHTCPVHQPARWQFLIGPWGLLHVVDAPLCYYLMRKGQVARAGGKLQLN